MNLSEKREEVTTEGGLDVVGNAEALKATVARLTEAGIATRSANFVDAFKDVSYIDVGHIEIWLGDEAGAVGERENEHETKNDPGRRTSGGSHF